MLKKILHGFDYDTATDFAHSLMPTLKYKLFGVFIMTIPVTFLDQVFGLNTGAVLALVLVMVLELLSGIYASVLRKEKFSSAKLSRFTFKSACYLVLIAVPYLMKTSYTQSGNSLAAGFFDWLHVFLVVHIVVEHMISILENTASVQGKDKTYWIEMLKSKVSNMIGK